MRLQHVKQTKVTTTTHSLRTPRDASKCEGMWHATVLAVELLGEQQLMLGTDDGTSKATVAPDFH